MFSFFWPEYPCNTSSQVLIAEEDFKDFSEIDYLDGCEPDLELEDLAS